MKKTENDSDLRVRRTRMSLRRAYITLAGQMKRRSISITKLTAEAMINRKTFYLHYDTLDQVLYDIADEKADETIEEIRAAKKNTLESALRAIGLLIGSDDRGLHTLFFSSEYTDFRDRYMEKVLSCDFFRSYISRTTFPDYSRGILSSFVNMYDGWQKDRSISYDDFIHCSTALFEHGLNGVR